MVNNANTVWNVTQFVLTTWQDYLNLFVPLIVNSFNILVVLAFSSYISWTYIAQYLQYYPKTAVDTLTFDSGFILFMFSFMLTESLWVLGQRMTDSHDNFVSQVQSSMASTYFGSLATWESFFNITNFTLGDILYYASLYWLRPVGALLLWEEAMFLPIASFCILNWLFTGLTWDPSQNL